MMQDHQENNRRNPKASDENTAKQENGKRKNERNLYEWMQALVCSVLTVVLLFTFAIRLIGVDGHSMVPTLQDGDRLLVVSSLLQHDYRYGDIVVLRKQSFLEEPIVKRVIATAGQTVDIDFVNGAVYVDGALLEEPYIAELTLKSEGTEFPLTVPEGSIFVLGDNRNHSNDSRDIQLGTVDTRYVIGRAVFLLFPGPDSVTERREFSRIGAIHGTRELPVGLTRLQREWA